MSIFSSSCIRVADQKFFKIHDFYNFLCPRESLIIFLHLSSDMHCPVFYYNKQYDQFVGNKYWNYFADFLEMIAVVY